MVCKKIIRHPVGQEIIFVKIMHFKKNKLPKILFKITYRLSSLSQFCMFHCLGNVIMIIVHFEFFSHCFVPANYFYGSTTLINYAITLLITIANNNFNLIGATTILFCRLKHAVRLQEIRSGLAICNDPSHHTQISVPL